MFDRCLCKLATLFCSENYNAEAEIYAVLYIRRASRPKPLATPVQHASGQLSSGTCRCRGADWRAGKGVGGCGPPWTRASKRRHRRRQQRWAAESTVLAHVTGYVIGYVIAGRFVWLGRLRTCSRARHVGVLVIKLSWSPCSSEWQTVQRSPPTALINRMHGLPPLPCFNTGVDCSNAATANNNVIIIVLKFLTKLQHLENT